MQFGVSVIVLPVVQLVTAAPGHVQTGGFAVPPPHVSVLLFGSQLGLEQPAIVTLCAAPGRATEQAENGCEGQRIQ